jgi:hypothetical protein
MTRNITGDAALEIAKKRGTEPIIIVEVDWTTTYSYCDRTLFGIPGKLLSIDDLDVVAQVSEIGQAGVAGSVRVTLDDTSGEIKNLFNTTDIHFRPARVYQAFGDLSLEDRFLLFSGIVASPFEYSEVTRQFSFDIISKVDDREIGFAPEEGEFDFIAESAVGKAWPLCFGSPIRVPAVKITERVVGKSLTKYSLISYGDLANLCEAAANLAEVEDLKTKADSNSAYSDEDYAALINSLTSARVNFDETISDLIQAAPSLETSIKIYADRCALIYRTKISRDTYAAQVRELTEATDEGEVITSNLRAQMLEAEGITTEALSDEEVPDTPKANQFQGTYEQLDETYSAAILRQDLNLTLLGNATSNFVIAANNIEIYEEQNKILARTLTQFSLSSITIDGGEDFPQNEDITILVKGLRLTGQMDDRVFTVDSILPTVADLEVVAVDGSQNQFDVDVGIDLRQLYCYIPSVGIFHVQEQNETRCRFSPLLYTQTGEEVAFFNLNGTPAVREVYDYATISEIAQASPIVLQSWINDIEDREDFANGIEHATAYDWALEIGDEVVLDGDYEEIYIANLIPSDEVHEVIGRRTIDGVDTLVPIPTQYYSIDLNESIAGQNATTIRFIRPLTSFVGQNWTGEVFVSLTSSEGPNTAQVIEYLLNTYSDLESDSTSFTEVQTLLANYPSHFALLDKANALATISEIAWQARCGIQVRNSVAYIKYLSLEDDSVQTLTEDNISDVIVSFTETDSIVTKFIALWKSDLSLEGKNKVVLRNNVPKYGTIDREYDFYIYNIQELVIKSATFWAIRLSNTWKRVAFRARLDTLNLEEYDTVTLDLDEALFSTGSTKAVVQKAVYDTSTSEIAYEVELPIRIGELTQYVFYWPAGAAADAEYPTELDLYAGET